MNDKCCSGADGEALTLRLYSPVVLFVVVVVVVVVVIVVVVVAVNRISVVETWSVLRAVCTTQGDEKDVVVGVVIVVVDFVVVVVLVIVNQISTVETWSVHKSSFSSFSKKPRSIFLGVKTGFGV